MEFVVEEWCQVANDSRDSGRFHPFGHLSFIPAFHLRPSGALHTALYPIHMGTLPRAEFLCPLNSQTTQGYKRFDHFRCSPDARRSFLVRSQIEESDLDSYSNSSSRVFDRRTVVFSVCAAALSSCIYGIGDAKAVKQNLLAGRIPGLSPPDENGLRTYQRPEAKSGGHGVGWSPIIPYSFKVPDDWEEVPVSIADLGGTEIDLRFSSLKEGNLSVVVAPVLRFASDLGENATIEKIGPPEKVIDAFGPELVGQNVEGRVKDMEVVNHDGRTYYSYELEVPHVFITATAAGNRLYLMTVSGNARQWKKYGPGLKQIAESFRVG